MAQEDIIRNPNRTLDQSAGALVHSRDVKDFKFPGGEPDPRGWDVRTADGAKIGKVADLLVDTSVGRVRYLEIEVDKDAAKQWGRDFALVPVGTARLDDDKDDVILSLNAADIGGEPAYDRTRFSRDYETSLRTYLGERGRTTATDRADAVAAADARAAARDEVRAEQRGGVPEREVDFYSGPEYDDQSFFGARRRAGSGVRSGAADRATTTGVADRVTDAVDNVKDRIDGNPASRPGPDPTDRRI